MAVCHHCTAHVLLCSSSLYKHSGYLIIGVFWKEAEKEVIGSRYPQTIVPIIKEPHRDFDVSNFERHTLEQPTSHDHVILEVCGARPKKHADDLRKNEGAHQDTINPPELHTEGDCTKQC